MSDDRLSLAIPIDVARHFDSTVSQAQIGADTFQNSTDDTDLIASMIEDAEDEWRLMTDDAMRISRVGVAGQRTTFEQPTYKISGHALTKGTFSGVWTDYLPEEKTVMLNEQNVLPFDSNAGDQVYFYKGLDDDGNSWEDITTDQGDLWDILDYREGRFVFRPGRITDEVVDTFDTAYGTVPSFLQRIRFAVSYRYGGLGGERGRATATDLDETGGLDSTQTDTVSVTDGSRFPTGSDAAAIVVLIDDEYLRVSPDPVNDQMTIVERGVRGTTAASHDNGARIQYTPPAVRKAVAARAGMQLITAGRYSEWLPDAEDTIDKGEMQSSLEAIWNTTVEAMSN